MLVCRVCVCLSRLSVSLSMHTCIVRLILGVFTTAALTFFLTGIQTKIGVKHAWGTLLMCLLQFHFLFYSSRPLPNTFALVLALVSFGYWVRERILACALWLTVAGVIFRSEIAVLLITVLVWELVITRSLPWLRLILCGVITAVCALGISICNQICMSVSQGHAKMCRRDCACRFSILGSMVVA